MASPISFHDLMARLQAGDSAAAAQLYDRFSQQLIALARSRLDGLIRRKVDPEDVVQSVYKSFFVRFEAGQFELANWNSLWGLLTRITLRKCGHQLEHFRAAKCDLRKEVQPNLEDSMPSWQAMAREPTPSEAAVLAETVEQLMRSVSNPIQREIISLSLQGYHPAEISEQINRSERTVHRTLRSVREWLDKRQIA